ncbi:hypothetical protein CsSME_00017302 [Camellia sinensis var. sinensis]
MTRADLPRTWEVVVANTGIASMHTVVTRFNTVVLLDRTNIGPSRKMLRKGHCRNDPHDPFLPDGTLLQSGGDLDGVHIHRDGAGDHAGRCTTSTSSHRPENRVQDDDEGIGLIDVNNGYKMIVVNIGHKIDVNSTKSEPQIDVNNGHKMIVNPAYRRTTSASSNRLENKVQDVDDEIGQIDY